MFIIQKATLKNFKQSYGDPHDDVAFALGGWDSLQAPQAILMLNDARLLILKIASLTNTLIEAREIQYRDMQNVRMKSHFLAFQVHWSFTAHNLKYDFYIPKKILTLGDSQKKFIQFLNQKFIHS